MLNRLRTRLIALFSAIRKYLGDAYLRAHPYGEMLVDDPIFNLPPNSERRVTATLIDGGRAKPNFFLDWDEIDERGDCN